MPGVSTIPLKKPAPKTKRDVSDAVTAVPPIMETPAIPSIPSHPKIPSIPSHPEIPSIPAIPAIPSIPAIPAIPSIPAIPAIPSIQLSHPFRHSRHHQLLTQHSWGR
ncbi:hypothetical protein PGT21_025344 [Puccinia graminis f. sp. tritici]|uniref:Uncharacterized protein n=1 Tax=Puccinia graminis f. sp. tritici TaxID=56615 RepID=A0A5B0MYJ4_PUCGR|nr:hypothetical protein PGT21_025344 [Puccinia graminis f. sp. tritici]